MKILVAGKEMELRAVGKNGIEWTEDLLGNYGALHCNDEGAYTMTEEELAWWEPVVEMLNKASELEEELDEEARAEYEAEDWPSDLDDEARARLEWLRSHTAQPQQEDTTKSFKINGKEVEFTAVTAIWHEDPDAERRPAILIHDTDDEHRDGDGVIFEVGLPETAEDAETLIFNETEETDDRTLKTIEYAGGAEPSRAQDIASVMSANGDWIPRLCQELCELAGMAQEYEAADGEGFEAVVYAAAEKLGVEI